MFIRAVKSLRNRILCLCQQKRVHAMCHCFYSCRRCAQFLHLRKKKNPFEISYLLVKCPLFSAGVRIQHYLMALALVSVMKWSAVCTFAIYRTRFTNVRIALKSYEMCKIGTFKCKLCPSLSECTRTMNAATFPTAKFIIWADKNRVKNERQTKLNTCNICKR